MFPASAKQEKFHFIAATSGNIDHFDGDPDLDYLQDVRQYMQRMFDGWDYQPNDRDFLQKRSGRQSQDFEKKFPFAIHRLQSRMYGSDRNKKREWVASGTVDTKNTPVTNRPDVHGSSIVTGVKTITRSDPRRSEEQLRLARVSYSIITKAIKN